MNNFRWVAVAVLLVSLTGCFASRDPQYVRTSSEFGFYGGLIDGFQLPFAAVVSIFDPKVTIYAVKNNGRPYSFGFFLGSVAMMALFADLARGRR